MLPASVRASGHADPRTIFEINLLGKVSVQLSRSVFRFGDCKLAKLNSGAGNHPASRPRWLVIKTSRGQFTLQCVEILALDVEQYDVLCVSRSKPAAAICFSKLGQQFQLIRRSPAANNRNAGVVQRVASLPMNSQMSAVASRD